MTDAGDGRGSVLDSRRLMGFAFLAPAVLYIVLLIGVSFFTAFAFSLSDATVGNASIRYAGLRNFRNVLNAPDFHAALRNTFVFTLVAQFFVLILANMLALILTAPLPDSRWVRGGMWTARLLLIMPWATPLSLSVIGWLWMFDSKYSPIDYLLEQLGLLGPGTVWGPTRNLTWLGKTYLSKASIIFVHVWRMTPLATVILMAGLSSIPTDVVDQAKADGARYFRALFQVKLPLILPIMLNSLLFAFIFTFGDLTVVYVLTRGGPINHTLTLPMYSFLVGIDGGNLSQGAAIALFIFPVLLAVAIVMLRTASRAQVR
ncbi:MAG: sugar ABC transporter permease [Spirochaetaceae bacterium]|nr:sugar ABC transporter permease [Spirochaetaceae bacterium]